jgi:hypothetical protein
MGQKEMAINYRTRFAYRIDAWDAKRHRAPGRRRGPSSCEGNVPGRMSALARDTNHLAPGHTSNRGQSADSACVRSAAAMTGTDAFIWANQRFQDRFLA